MRLRLLLAGCVTWSCFSETSGTSSAGSDPTTDADSTDASASSSASTTVGESSSSASTTEPSTTEPSTTNPTTGPDMTTTPDTGEVESDTEECPADSVPAPPSPGEGWTGPFMLVPPEGECLQPLDEVKSSPIFAMPDIVTECECACVGDCTLAVASPGDSDCGTVLVSSLGDEECHPVVAGAYVRPSGSAGDFNACDNPTFVAPPVGFAESHRVCAGNDAPCLPMPPASIGPCFRTPGHTASCEAIGLPVEIRVMLDADVVCEPCEPCTTALNNACLEATVTAHPTNACVDPGTPISNGQCTLVEGTGVRIDHDLTCPTTAAETTPVEPTTFCCLGPG